MENPHKGGLSKGLPQPSTTFAIRILPTKPPLVHPDWKRLCRASQDAETKRLVSAQLRAIAAHVGNNVIQFPTRNRRNAKVVA